MTPKQSPILDALDADSYEYLADANPELLAAIEKEVQRGLSPLEIKRMVTLHVGYDRLALALRCYQAARFIAKGD